jgi:predicted MFS family arabinose efflux permease
VSDHYPPERRASALGIYAIGVPLGVMLGSVAGGWLAETFSWRAAFVVVGAPGLVLAAVLAATLREPPRGLADGARAAASSPAPGFGRVLRAAWAKRSLRHAIAGCALGTLVANSVALFAPLYLSRRFGLGMAQVGLLYGLVSGASGVAGMLAGGFGASLGVRRDARFYAWAPAIGCLAALPAYAFAYSRASLDATLVLVFVAWICASLSFAPTFALAQNLVEPRMRASAAALVLLCMNLAGQGLGPLVLGWASDRLAARAFDAGDYASLCRGGAVGPGVAAACREASAAGLQQSILMLSAVFLWAGLHYLRSARFVREELPEGRAAGSR